MLHWFTRIQRITNSIHVYQDTPGGYSVSAYQQLTCILLRLKATMQFLGFVFGVHALKVSHVFITLGLI